MEKDSSKVKYSILLGLLGAFHNTVTFLYIIFLCKIFIYSSTDDYANSFLIGGIYIILFIIFVILYHFIRYKYAKNEKIMILYPSDIVILAFVVTSVILIFIGFGISYFFTYYVDNAFLEYLLKFDIEK